MALYTLGDSHLSGGVDKPMSKFGGRWTGHTEKIRKNWCALVEDGDTVVLPGDISWAMTLEEAAADFRFLDALPGRKILGKGNHDFWWTTVSKMKHFLADIGVTSVDFLQNNAFRVDSFLICGARGWFIEEKQQNTVFPTDYQKLVAREAIRLDLSLAEGEKLRHPADETAPADELLAFLHFPPVYGSFICQPLLDVLRAHGVTRCFYGHIHGKYSLPPDFIHEGITFSIVSADYLNFVPRRLYPAPPRLSSEKM